MGVAKQIFSNPLFSRFFIIVKILVTYWTSHSYLTGVAAAKLLWHLAKWMWFCGYNPYFCLNTIFRKGEFREPGFSNPHPWTIENNLRYYKFWKCPEISLDLVRHFDFMSDHGKRIRNNSWVKKLLKASYQTSLWYRKSHGLKFIAMTHKHICPSPFISVRCNYSHLP